MSELTLVSHPLCPYVQRAAIVLAEKGVRYTRKDVDLANKPDWFLAISPLGKTPVLLVDGSPLFESAVICDYLDETLEPRLHPQDPLRRAQHRAWVEYGSTILNTIALFYAANDDQALQTAASDIRQKFSRIELALTGGPYFSGNDFSVVDAVFGPVFRYFDVFDDIGDFGFFAGQPRVQAWRAALARRPSVRAAVRDDYRQRLLAFLGAKNSALAQHMRSAIPV
jgi:glutathione S-transferase